MKRLITIILLLYTTAIISQPENVLFLGNSYTANALPVMFKRLCRAAGDSVFVAHSSPGGMTYALQPNAHLYSQQSQNLISEGIWDYVVIQEQSQIPTIPYYRSGYFFPGASGLDALIKQANPCSRTMLYMTWGRKLGGQQCIGSYCSPVFIDYFHMQDSLEASYMRNAEQINGYVSPAGISWKNSILNGDPIELFAPDNSHPSEAGFYLNACTFYAAMFLESPVGLDYYANLDSVDAVYLQQLAHFTVLTDPGQWFLQPILKPRADFVFEVISDTVFFTDMSQNASNYLWNFGDGNTATTQNPTHIYTQSGTYEVTQYVYDSCHDDTMIKEVNVVVSGTDEFYEPEVLIYPNPASEILNINIRDNDLLTHTIKEGFYKMTVYDIYGRVQDEYILKNKKKFRLDISSYPKGTYIIHLQTNTNKIVKRKFVVY